MYVALGFLGFYDEEIYGQVNYLEDTENAIGFYLLLLGQHNIIYGENL
ncbi:MAG: hypothetical protein FWD52_04405 [Candidatus Bathyarchaeota archaeon]|nr:hypothetical protein [Candidatus Termiticorpusculum sp.]